VQETSDRKEALHLRRPRNKLKLTPLERAPTPREQYRVQAARIDEGEPA
jgi:hypothetical protein